MSANFQRCLAIVLTHEGGWSDDPRDPGGATMQGVTLAAYSRFLGRQVSKDELRHMPPENRDALYREEFWERLRGDDLPLPFAMVTMDAAVNSGVHRGVAWLQLALNVTADGLAGHETLVAANGCRNVAAAIRDACRWRLKFLAGLPNWQIYHKGWGKRVIETQNAALDALAETALPEPPLDEAQS